MDNEKNCNLQNKHSDISHLGLIIGFDKPEDGRKTGTLASDLLPLKIPFDGLDDLTAEINRVCDYFCFPEEWESKRSLYGNKKVLSHGELQDAMLKRWNGKIRERLPRQPFRNICASVTMIARQHASIQGELQIDRIKVCFRSAMELQSLLNEALEQRLNSANSAGCLCFPRRNLS